MFESETIAPHPRHSLEDVDNCMNAAELSHAENIITLSQMPGLKSIFESIVDLGDDNA
ncbi:hypothetical protein KC950_03770 [Candidatus Saccharibacteria bacterium]|nr:hypothetical protein [Candidatus Saccharibacteria bacterium]